jgi:hypothetical protein
LLQTLNVKNAFTESLQFIDYVFKSCVADWVVADDFSFVDYTEGAKRSGCALCGFEILQIYKFCLEA